MVQMNLWDKISKVKWNLLVVYGATQEEYKFDFPSELSRFCDANSDPILIGDDFNMIRYAKEKSSNIGVHRHNGVSKSIIGFFELREPIMNGRIFTWSNN